MTTGIVTAQSGLNVRIGPGAQYKKIGSLAYNASVTVTGSKNGWYAVTQSGQTGYVSASFINITGGATEAVSNTASASGTSCTVTADALNVRAGAGTGYGVLGTLRKGESVTTVGQSGSWLKIFYNGQTGWIAQKYVTQTGGAAASASSATETSSGTSAATSTDSSASVVGPGASVTGNSSSTVTAGSSTSVVGPGASVTGNSSSTVTAGSSTSVVGPGAALTDASAAASSAAQFSSAEIAQIKSWYQSQNYTKDFIRKMQAAVGTAADGSVGTNTINAVAAWQKSKNLTADGKFGKSCAAAAGLTIDQNSGGVCADATQEQRSRGAAAVSKAREFMSRFTETCASRSVHYTSKSKNYNRQSTRMGNYSQHHRDAYFYKLDPSTKSYYYDCSSFTHRSWKDATGIYIGSNSTQQHDNHCKNCNVTNNNNYRIPGDILWRSGHVAIYAGNGSALDAGGDPVKVKTDLSEFKKTFRPSANS